MTASLYPDHVAHAWALPVTKSLLTIKPVYCIFSQSHKIELKDERLLLLVITWMTKLKRILRLSRLRGRVMIN